VARASGAQIVGGAELVKEVEEGKHKFDKCISTPGMFSAVTKLARILGPKGLMPTAKKGTVTEDIEGVIKAQTAAFDIRGDKHGVVHTSKLRDPSSSLGTNCTFLVGVSKL